LSKPAGPAAPPAPDAETEIVDWKARRRNHIEHADQCLHSIEFAAHILAQDAALEIGQNGVGSFHRFLDQPAQHQHRQHDREQDAINGKRGKAPGADPLHKPGDNRQRDNE